MSCTNRMLPDWLPYPVIGLKPVLDVPAILEERPDIILVINIPSALMRLHSI